MEDCDAICDAYLGRGNSAGLITYNYTSLYASAFTFDHRDTAGVYGGFLVGSLL